MVFRYAIATGRATRDIAVDLRGALTTPKVNHRAAITEPSELSALLRAIEGYSGQPTTWLALQLSALRPGELRFARWKEIDFDKAVWTVPAPTMKMKRPPATHRSAAADPPRSTARSTSASAVRRVRRRSKRVTRDQTDARGHPRRP
jgi:integrase